MGKLSQVLFSEGGKGWHVQAALLAVLVLFILLVSPFHVYSSALVAIIFGMGISLTGDWLLVKYGYSRIRLVTYSLAILFYSAAYWTQTSGLSNWWLPILLCASGIVTFLLILPQVDSHVFSTAAIGTLLLGLVWASGEWWIQQHQFNAVLALLGAGCLFVTALSLAIRTDGSVFSRANRVFLFGYIVSQVLFTLSVLL